MPIIHYFDNMNLCTQCLPIQAGSIARAFVRCAKHTRQQQKATGYVQFAAFITLNEKQCVIAPYR